MVQSIDTPPTLRRAAPLGLTVLALTIVYIVWGSTYLGIRIVVDEAPPLTSMGFRFLISGALLCLLIAVRKGPRHLRVTRRQLLGAGTLGLLLPLLGNGMVAVAERHGATSGLTALLIASVPLTIVIFRLVERDVPTPRTVVGVLTGFVGLSVLLIFGRGGVDDVPLGPMLLVVFAATCWALGSYLQPRLWLPKDPFVVAGYEMLIGGLLAVIVGLVAGENLSVGYSAKTWWVFGYLVVFGSVIAFSAYVWLVANVPISLVATYAYVNPVIAVFLGWLVLDEAITLATAVGGAIVVGSVALVITSERADRKSLDKPG